jgi:hypothetical protein
MEFEWQLRNSLMLKHRSAFLVYRGQIQARHHLGEIGRVTFSLGLVTSQAQMRQWRAAVVQLTRLS